MNIYAFADEASPMIDLQIEAMKRNGLNGLEIRNVDNVNVADISLDAAKLVRQKMDDAGLKVWSIGSPIGKINIETDDFPAHLEKFKHVLEVSHIVGAGNIRLFSFYIPEGKDPEDYREEVISRLGQMLEIAQGSGIALCHENEKGIYGDIASRCLKLHQALPELKAILDPANFIQCGQDPWQAWELLHPYIQYLHVKDAMADGSVVPAGCGVGRLREILRAYQANGGENLTIEPHLHVFSGLSQLQNGEGLEKIGIFTYPTPDAAFHAACNALKGLL